MFKFITNKPFWVNLLAAIAIIVILVFIFLQSLEFFTNHGKVLRVPSVKGLSVDQATKTLEAQGFEVSIQDSVYIDTAARLSVIKQFPDPEVTVKVNRTVYLTINRAVPPIIDMPNLLNMSFLSAQDYLRSLGLKLGDTTYKPDFAKNAVISQLVNGKDIKPGEKVSMGTVVSLVFGSGISNEEIAVPDMFGMTLSEAEALLAANGLTRGATVVDPNVKDTSSAYVYRQSPERRNEEGRTNGIRPGQLVTLWLGVEKPVRADTATIQPATNF